LINDVILELGNFSDMIIDDHIIPINKIAKIIMVRKNAFILIICSHIFLFYTSLPKIFFSI
jgi:hypothetical protein